VQLDWGEKEVYFGAIFSDEINQLIDHHLKNNIDVGVFLSVKLRENKCLIDDGYYVDWKRRMLVFTNINYAHTYRLIIAMNKLYANQLLADMYDK
jgi:hypothetical protein